MSSSRLAEYVATGRVTKGALDVRNPKGLRQAMRCFADGEVTITVERRHATRSQQANSWYWGCILAHLAEHTGYTVDEMHEYCKEQFNAKVITIADTNGEIKDAKRIGQTTTKLNKLTFGEYCERIREWAARDLGVAIPDPDPDWRTEAA